MPFFTIASLRWDWSSYAKFPRKPNFTPTPYISDKIARDIGMSPQDLALLRHEWPSQSKDRPLF